MSMIWRNRLIGIVLAAVIYFADQALKGWIIDDVRLRQVGQIDVIPGFFSLTWVQNFGVSLGMFTATSMEMRWALVAVTGMIALVVAIWLLRERSLPDILPLGLVLGGAMGNIHDRFNLGYVVDFLDFHFWGWTPFVFNIADAAITIGVAIILARALFMGEKPANAQAPDTHAGPHADKAAETD